MSNLGKQLDILYELGYKHGVEEYKMFKEDGYKTKRLEKYFKNLKKGGKAEQYSVTHDPSTDKPTSLHNRRFPKWEKENWD